MVRLTHIKHTKLRVQVLDVFRTLNSSEYVECVHLSVFNIPQMILCGNQMKIIRFLLRVFWVQYCSAVIVWKGQFNEKGMWRKVKAGGVFLTAYRAERAFHPCQLTHRCSRLYFQDRITVSLRAGAQIWLWKWWDPCCLTIAALWPRLREHGATNDAMFCDTMTTATSNKWVCYGKPRSHAGKGFQFLLQLNEKWLSVSGLKPKSCVDICTDI